MDHIGSCRPSQIHHPKQGAAQTEREEQRYEGIPRWKPNEMKYYRKNILGTYYSQSQLKTF